MSQQTLIVITVFVAVALDVAILFWARRSLKKHEFSGAADERAVILLGHYTPLLTWFKILVFSFAKFLVDAKTSLAQVLSPQPINGAISPQYSIRLRMRQQWADRSQILWLKTGLRAIQWVILVMVAVLPILLVVSDRWFDSPMKISFLDGFWGNEITSRGIAFPVYFSVVIICSFILPWVIFAAGNHLRITNPFPVAESGSTTSATRTRSRQVGTGLVLIAFALSVLALIAELTQHKPEGGYYLLALILYCLGWILRESSIRDFLWRLITNRRVILELLILQVSLIACLYYFYAGRDSLWIWVIVLSVALIFSLRDYKRIPVIFWITNLALILYTFRINSWEFSVIGDEFDFYKYAQKLVHEYGPLIIINNLFDGTAVFGVHPFFSSAIQAIFVYLFNGSNNFGWRFSNIFLSALSLLFFYIFFRQFVSNSVSLLASLFLGSSHYLMTFGKIGYNNLQALLVMSIVLACGGWAVKRKQLLPMVFFGLSLGLCFYVFPAALYVLPVAVFMLVFFDPPLSTAARKRWGVMLLSTFFLLLPLLIQADYWENKIQGTVFFVPAIVSTVGSAIAHILSNLIYALYSFLYIPSESHFVVASYLDPITGVLALLGLGYILVFGWRNRSLLFILLSFITLLFLVGASHGYQFPPTTRMFMLLPFWSLLAAIGVEWLIVQIKILRESQIAAHGFGASRDGDCRRL